MNKLGLYFFILLIANSFIGISQTFERQILSSTDDAEEKFDGSYVTTSSSDIEMVYDDWNSQGLQKLGFRFNDIIIPSNAVITNAYIQFTADGSNSGSFTMTIKGEDVANSLPFSSSANNISNRVTTTSSEQWTSIPSWSDNQSGVSQRTPDLSAIVSEIITSNGWQPGNPISFIITGTGNDSDKRKAYSYDGSPLNSAKLIIEYTSNFDTDLELIECISPADNNFPNSSSVVEVEILNNGNLPATNYNVSYFIDGNLMATEPGVTSLNQGESTVFTFAQTADFSVVGTYDFKVEVTIMGDEYLINNDLTKTVSVFNEVEPLFFSQGTSWRYWDSPANPGNDWETVGFDDSGWPIGIGHMGFGDGDEQTDLNNGLISYYFRKDVNVLDVNQLNDVYLHIIHDEGALVYINGQEVLRSEMMPLGTITHNTTARQTINSTIENDFYTYKLNASSFVNGNNSIAITTHNRSTSDDDVSFNAYFTPNYTYDQDGPYVFYDGSDIIVEEVTPTGLISNTYTSTNGLILTCTLPHMNTSFSFPLKSQITTEPSIFPDTPSKFLVISDFDGHIEGLTMVLKGEGIIDENFNWTYGDGHLIISGDLFDRGFHITECMWLLYKLEGEAEAAGGKVHLVIGNHEMMNMTDDWRYVELKYFNDAHLMGKRMSELYDSDTELGRWLRSKNIIEKVGDYAFMHGGISPAVNNLNLSYEQINDYGRLEMNEITCPNNDCNIVNGSDGIYWYRGMVEEDLTQLQVNTILDSFNVERVVLGHTKDNTIRSLYDDKVLAIDMYHVTNFNNGYMEALQFEIGCFYLFHTNGTSQNYTLLSGCDEFNGIPMELNGEGQLKIYPNPTSDVLNIKLPNSMVGNYDYTVVNLEGNIVSQGNINSDLNTIDVSSFSAGKYVLTLSNSESLIRGSFILKE